MLISRVYGGISTLGDGKRVRERNRKKAKFLRRCPTDRSSRQTCTDIYISSVGNKTKKERKSKKERELGLERGPHQHLELHTSRTFSVLCPGYETT